MLFTKDGMYRASRTVRLTPAQLEFLAANSHGFVNYLWERFSYSAIVDTDVPFTRLEKRSIEARTVHDVDVASGLVISSVAGSLGRKSYIHRVAEHRFNEFDLALHEFMKKKSGK